MSVINFVERYQKLHGINGNKNIGMIRWCFTCAIARKHIQPRIRSPKEGKSLIVSAKPRVVAVVGPRPAASHKSPNECRIKSD